LVLKMGGAGLRMGRTSTQPGEKIDAKSTASEVNSL
jgi:hypothetical protein